LHLGLRSCELRKILVEGMGRRKILYSKDLRPF
jgi:hypothetical protein